MELLNKLEFNVLYDYGSKVIMAIGLLAFIVSAIVQVLKGIKWLDKRVPTQVVVIVTSMVVTPVCTGAMASYYGIALEWFTVFASFIAAFIVALVSMDGWERVTELAGRMIKKQ